MGRSTWHWIVDAASATVMLALACTGLLIYFVLPAGSGQSRVWGWTRHDWGDLHLYMAVGFIGCLLVHLILNWGWVCVVTGKLLGRGAAKPSKLLKAFAGGGALLAAVLVVGGFLWLAAAWKVDIGRGGGGGPGHAEVTASTDGVAAASPGEGHRGRGARGRGRTD